MTDTWARQEAPLGDPLAGVERPRGDSLGVQGLGGRYASGAVELTAGARGLLGLVGGVLGQSWSGTAAAACAAACVRSAQAVLLSAQAYENAGAALSAYGARLGMAQAEYDAASRLGEDAVAEERAHQAAAVAGLDEPGGGPQGYGFGDLIWRSPLREVARARAEQAVADAAAAARQAAGVLDATLTPFKPADTSIDWAGQAVGFGRGVKDGVVEPVAMVGGLVGLNGDTGENWSALASGVGYGFTHPGDFAKALVNWDDIEKGEYGHWAGELVPGAVAAFFTGGAAAGLKGAEATATAQRMAEALKTTSGLANGLPGALKDVKVLVAVTPDGLRVPVGIDATKLHQLLSEASRPVAGGADEIWTATTGLKGTLKPNSLREHEFEQAQEIVSEKGGHFEGHPQGNAPGIDGWYEGAPASLKTVAPNVKHNIRALANEFTKAQNSLAKSGISGAVLFVRAPGMEVAEILTSRRAQEILDMGGFLRILVRGRDGWAEFG